jgi:tRNA pseudouridine55 synthase
MHGVLIIDKPQGITSHDVVRRIRRVLKTRRVGHAGTLDPLATGILQVAVGEGTRLVQFLMEGDKTYRATLRLGEVTDTQDAEGTITERRPVPQPLRGADQPVPADVFGAETQRDPSPSAGAPGDRD